MNIATMQFFSEALERHVTYSVILPNPKLGRGPFPVLYQLHGYTDDHHAWLRFSNLTKYVEKWPLMVVLPDGGTSFYLNYTPRERYEEFIMQDLPNHVRNTFNVRDGKAAIGGLSMGGFGALRLGLKYPHRFASIWAHSSAAFDAEIIRERFDYPPQDVDDADLFATATRAKDQELPQIAFDCGTEDRLLASNRRFHKHLNELGINHTYKEFAGTHEWPYWDLHVQEALVFHGAALGLTPDNSL